MLVIAIAFPLIYINLFSANFISWDDTEYVLENQDVHLFNMKHFFSKSYIGNYHPITMISYAIDWKLFGKSAFGYHVENIVWHFATTTAFNSFFKNFRHIINTKIVLAKCHTIFST